MSIVRSTALLFVSVFTSVLFSAEGAGNCEAELIQGCISNYKGILRGKPNPEDHCSRVQDVVSCFAENPSCKGQSVNRFRFWILQEAMLEAKLKICPDVNYKCLKDCIKNTDVAKEHTLVENYGGGDSIDPCAAEVHTTCSKTFLDLMKQNQRICGDSAQWFACYSKIAEKKNCSSLIIKNYAAFVEKMGIQLVSDALFANSCSIAI